MPALKTQAFFYDDRNAAALCFQFYVKKATLPAPPKKLTGSRWIGA